jgi:hypothetical protein
MVYMGLASKLLLFIESLIVDHGIVVYNSQGHKSLNDLPQNYEACTVDNDASSMHMDDTGLMVYHAVVRHMLLV